MKARVKSLRYLLSIFPGLLVIIGNLAGGYWSLLNFVFMIILLIPVEWMLKENRTNQPAEDGTVPDLILGLHVVVHTLSIITLIYGIHTEILRGRFIWFAALSTGINSGSSGIISAHELIHRASSTAQRMGIWNLLLVNYAHFFIEHVRNHHKHVGTSKDPATARFGESLYLFALRTVPQQFFSSLRLESDRLLKQGIFGYSLRNFVVRVTLVQIILCVAVFYFFGVYVLLAYLWQSAIAISLLEFVNYVEHYGLQRLPGEKVSATHSWQSDAPVSRLTLIELTRHSDHHLVASKPYFQLLSHDKSPVLPSGYFGVFLLALIPPLWFRKVNPLLVSFQKKKEF